MLPDPSTLAVFMAAVLALNLTPGPDMLFCFATGVSRGRAAGAVAAIGVGAGTLVHTCAAALGLAGLLLASPLAFDIVRYAGAAYLVWLAWKTLRAAPLGAPDAAPAPRSLWRVFGNGAVTNVLNPKVALFFLAFLPQFVDPSAGPVAPQMLVLGTMLVGLGVMSDGTYALLAAGAGRKLRETAAARRRLDRLSGGVFIGLGLVAALAGEPRQK
jgi:threonine/homoserine/homoserine lactone efflux protein